MSVDYTAEIVGAELAGAESVSGDEERGGRGAIGRR